MTNLNFGPTGAFPDGKLTPNDDGELTLGVTVHDGRLIIAFGKPVEWIGLDRPTAEAFIDGLLRRLTEIPR